MLLSIALSLALMAITWTILLTKLESDRRIVRLRILWESFPIPYDPFVLRGRLCSPLAEKIRTAFLEKSAALDEMFNALQMKGFTSVNDERYREIRLMYENQPGN